MVTYQHIIKNIHSDINGQSQAFSERLDSFSKIALIGERGYSALVCEVSFKYSYSDINDIELLREADNQFWKVTGKLAP